jgi:hypothetical protein
MPDSTSADIERVQQPAPNRTQQTFVWLALFLSIALTLHFSGRLVRQLVPDSAGYIDYPFDSLSSALSFSRTPGYPLFLRVARLFGKDYQVVPLLHLVAHLFACWVFWRALDLYQMRLILRTAIVASLLWSCTLFDNVQIVSTDVLSASLGILSCALLLIWSRQPTRKIILFAIMVVSFLAIMVRPAYLFLVVALPTMGLLILQLRQVDWRGNICRVSLLGVMIVIPLVGYASLRLAVTGDFGIVSFSEFSAAGLTTQYLDESISQTLTGEQRKLAEQILKRRQRLMATHPDWHQGEPQSYMETEQRWEPMVYQVVMPTVQELYGDDRKLAHAQVRKLNHRIIVARPRDALRWLLLATRQSCRLAVGDAITHPPFLAVCLLSVAWFALSICWSGHRSRWLHRKSVFSCMGYPEIVIMAIVYFAGKVSVVILCSAPFGRYVDAAAVFFPAAILGWVAHRCFPPPADRDA